MSVFYPAGGKMRKGSRFLPPGVKNLFTPMESSPEWILYNTPGPSPTSYQRFLGEITINEIIPPGIIYPMMFDSYGMVSDVNMQFKITFWASGTGKQSFLAVKGQDFNNFVGVQQINGALVVSETVDGSQITLISVDVTDNIIGQICTFEITNRTTINLYLDGNLIGTAATVVSGNGYMGVYIQAHNEIGTLLTALDFQGQRAGVEDLVIPCDLAGWTVDVNSFWEGYPPEQAFNCTAGHGSDSWVSADKVPPPFTFDCTPDAGDTAKQWTLTMVQMKGRETISDDHMNARRPDPLVIQASNNGVDFVEVGRFTGTGPWNAGEVKTFIITEDNEGRFFRVIWEDNGGAPEDGGQIGWIKLFGYDASLNPDRVIYHGREVTHYGQPVFYND